MKCKMKHCTLSGNEGFTLIEAIVSVALLAILSIMLVSVMAVSLAAAKATRVRTSDAATAAGKIESQRAVNDTTAGTAGTLTITFNNGAIPKHYDVNGEYLPGNNGNIAYKEFVPDD